LYEKRTRLLSPNPYPCLSENFIILLDVREFSDERSEGSHDGADQEGSSEYTEEINDSLEDLESCVGTVLIGTTLRHVLLIVLYNIKYSFKLCQIPIFVKIKYQMKKSEGVDIFFCWGGKTHKKIVFC